MNCSCFFFICYIIPFIVKETPETFTIKDQSQDFTIKNDSFVFILKQEEISFKIIKKCKK